MSPSTAAAPVEASRRALLRAITEESFQRTVIGLARLHGWLVFHPRPAPDPRRRGAWRTPMEGDKGFPDLVLLRPPRLVVAELKSEVGRLRPDQLAWMMAFQHLADRGAVEAYVWRPRDREQIEAALR